MTPEAIRDLLDRFEAAELSSAEWTHQAHLLVGACYVDRLGAEAALPRLRAGIRSLNQRNGVANTATSGYHETITRAYTVLLAAFWATCPPVTLAERLQLLLAHPLSDRQALLHFYTPARLMSPAARADGCEPDLCVLELAAFD